LRRIRRWSGDAEAAQTVAAQVRIKQNFCTQEGEGLNARDANGLVSLLSARLAQSTRGIDGDPVARMTQISALPRTAFATYAHVPVQQQHDREAARCEHIEQCAAYADTRRRRIQSLSPLGAEARRKPQGALVKVQPDAPRPALALLVDDIGEHQIGAGTKRELGVVLQSEFAKGPGRGGEPFAEEDRIAGAELPTAVADRSRYIVCNRRRQADFIGGGRGAGQNDRTGDNGEPRNQHDTDAARTAVCLFGHHEIH